jgi:hypothetical protein
MKLQWEQRNGRDIRHVGNLQHMIECRQSQLKGWEAGLMLLNKCKVRLMSIEGIEERLKHQKRSIKC